MTDSAPDKGLGTNPSTGSMLHRSAFYGIRGVEMFSLSWNSIIEVGVAEKCNDAEDMGSQNGVSGGISPLAIRPFKGTSFPFLPRSANRTPLSYMKW
jgi:hypothetical protein